MDDNRIEGKGRQIKGAIKEGVAKMTGNTAGQAEGKVDKVVGKVQEGFGKLKDEARAAKAQNEERRDA